MAFSTNIIYNGDFSHGTDTWSGNGITVSDGVVTLTGDISSSVFVPVANGRIYRLTYDVKFNTTPSNYFYIALHPYDSNKQFVPIANTNKPYGSNTNTTLAADLKNGDTTVTLTSSANWPTSRTYQRVGICSNLAWGYGRAVSSYSYSSLSGNVITLKSAYSGATIPAGTKVAEFENGSTYFYPHSMSGSSLSSDWKTYTVTFNGGDQMRYSCRYFKFATLGYSNNYSMRNIKIECISDYQCCDYNVVNDTDLNKQGVFYAQNYNNCGMSIRYIRDSIAGSTANSNNHWNEIQAFNSVGENIAWNKKINGSLTVATDGNIDSRYISTSSSTSAVLDLEFIENIEKIKIWHYYPDGRTYYNNVTEVSQDGTNWIQVYAGQKPETSAGNEIILVPNKAMIYKTGEISAHDFYEL